MDSDSASFNEGPVTHPGDLILVGFPNGMSAYAIACEQVDVSPDGKRKRWMVVLDPFPPGPKTR